MELDTRLNASVSIDGAAIRRIREEKRLTQLYVAKVVGVTTDTVSRWENNRYPTMRRDNALKLAEALEAELDEILKHEEPVEDVEAEGGGDTGKPRWLLPIAVTVVVIVVSLFFVLTQSGSRAVKMQAERLLPTYAAPGSRVLVRVHFSSEKPLKGMILREDFPATWNLIASEPPASGVDNEKGSVRWIFRKPQTQMLVAYLLDVPKTAVVGESVVLQGELIANPDGQRTAVNVKSQGQMQVQPFHWADRNGDLVIEDLEILEVSDVMEETGSLHLGWDLIEQLWDAGHYKWDEKNATFVPM